MEYEYIFLGSLTLIYLLALMYWVFLKDIIFSLNFLHLKKLYTRVSSYGDLTTMGRAQNPVFRSLNTAIVIVSISTLIVVLVGAVFLLVMPAFGGRDVGKAGFSIAESSIIGNDECNVFDGKWVRDEGYNFYNATQCSFLERGFDCVANGRKDREYLKWSWKPNGCELPRFNVGGALRYLRDKRVVFVGDSLTRTQWESFVCMLMSGVEDRRFVYEVNQNKISKQIRFLNVRFDSYNFTVEFYRSVFLVLPSSAPSKAPKRVKLALRLDKMDSVSDEWVDADVLIFNTGHWWTKTKLFETGTYFQVGGSLKLGMPVTKALTKALETWSSWVDSKINPNKTHVFFRTFEATHWSGRNHNTCKVTRRPMSTTQGREKNSITDAILKVVKKVSVPVTALHVTPMGAYRSDAHVGTWSDNPSVPDCSHWCLPGVPDMWNEIVFAYLLHKDQISHKNTAN
ncbi:hypothetical protein vseg_009097 [Gypsophila vaccaria]